MSKRPGSFFADRRGSRCADPSRAETSGARSKRDIREARDCAFATRPAREPREAAAEVPPWARNPRAR